MTLNLALLAHLRGWLPKVRDLRRTHGSFGPAGFNETWAREAAAMCTRHNLTPSKWLAHVRHLDDGGQADVLAARVQEVADALPSVPTGGRRRCGLCGFNRAPGVQQPNGVACRCPITPKEPTP